MIDFNINNSVLVKLTDYGRKVHRDDFYKWMETLPKRPGQSSPAFDYMPPKEDADGWSRWRLWSLMQSFGKYMNLAGPNPFQTNIRLETVEQPLPK